MALCNSDTDAVGSAGLLSLRMLVSKIICGSPSEPSMALPTLVASETFPSPSTGRGCSLAAGDLPSTACAGRASGWFVGDPCWAMLRIRRSRGESTESGDAEDVAAAEYDAVLGRGEFQLVAAGEELFFEGVEEDEEFLRRTK